MENALSVIQILGLLDLEAKIGGPSLVEAHYLAPSNSWILKEVQNSKIIDSVRRVLGIIDSSVVTPQQFKELFMTSSKMTTTENVEVSLIEHYYLARLHGFSVLQCSEAARLVIPDLEQPSFDDVVQMVKDLQKFWCARSPDAAKYYVDPTRIKAAEEKASGHSSKTLISKSLLIAAPELRELIHKYAQDNLASLLAGLNQSDEFESAFFQKVWSLLSEDELVHFTWEMLNGTNSNRSEALKSWEQWLHQNGFLRKSAVKMRSA